MDIIFLGTRGGITARSPLHYYHSSLLILHNKARVLIDCGTDWLGFLQELCPTALFITHAHPDHVGGLKNGCPYPVYATEQTQALLRRYPLPLRYTIAPGTPQAIDGLSVTAFSLDHSLRAPAVGYRITDQRTTFFYAPDVALIQKQQKALSGVDLYIGDGAIINRSLLLRKRQDHTVGHSPIATQLSWCQQAGIQQAIITHCGTEIVTGKPAIIEKKIEALAQQYHLRVNIAYDGMKVKR